MNIASISLRRTRIYWAVCYAHECRTAGPCLTAEQAAREAYGLYDPERMTLMQWPSKPAYMAQYRKRALLTALVKQHMEKTGNRIHV